MLAERVSVQLFVLLAVFLFAFRNCVWPCVWRELLGRLSPDTACVLFRDRSIEVAHRGKNRQPTEGYFYAFMGLGAGTVGPIESSVYGQSNLCCDSASVTLVSISAACLVCRTSGPAGSLFGGDRLPESALASKATPLFFGTVLRPYAALIFGTTVILWIGGKNLGLAKLHESAPFGCPAHGRDARPVRHHVTRSRHFSSLYRAIIGK